MMGSTKWVMGVGLGVGLGVGVGGLDDGIDHTSNLPLVHGQAPFR